MDVLVVPSGSLQSASRAKSCTSPPPARQHGWCYVGLQPLRTVVLQGYHQGDARHAQPGFERKWWLDCLWSLLGPAGRLFAWCIIQHDAVRKSTSQFLLVRRGWGLGFRVSPEPLNPNLGHPDTHGLNIRLATLQTMSVLLPSWSSPRCAPSTVV
jgi:hypothetical protein